jgi:tetrahydromethanopterin S-methyltransferase subunit B
MEELIDFLIDIRDGISEMNLRLAYVSNTVNELKRDGIFSTLSDIYEKIDDIKGQGLYNDMSDICYKLDDIKKALHSIDMNTMNI